jgi:acetyltransferase-like isoleucine patch superfamily enzyme
LAISFRSIKVAVKYPYTFTYTEEIEQFFIDNNIFLKHPFSIKGIYQMGDKVTLRGQVLLEPFATMPGKNIFASCDAFSFFQSNFAPPTRVGRYCSISWACTIMAGDHPIHHVSTHPFTYRDYYEKLIRNKFGDAVKPVSFNQDRGATVIGNDVWIGQNTILRNGITIGDGAVIAAGAVVTKDVPPYAIMGGNPAKVIRYRFDEQLREKLLASRWWQYSSDAFIGLDVSDPEAFVDGLMDRVAKGEVAPYEPPKFDLAEEVDAIVRASTTSPSAT